MRTLRIWALAEVRWAAAAVVLFLLGGGTQLAGAPAPVWWALYLGCYAAGGWEPALAGLRRLLERSLDVDLLMIVAAVGAAAIGQVVDGGLLIVIFATSGALESFATARTADSVRTLLDLAPERAVRVDEDGREHVVSTAALCVGDVVRIRPGERIGADAVVLHGVSEVDQATLTGEPLPVARSVGDEVLAGTLNGTGALLVRVHRAAGESVIARVVALVDEASATKAQAQLFIETVEQRYSAGVVAAALALFGVPLLLGADLRGALLRAMTFMIVVSPCAVVLATMPPLLSAIALAGRHGVLVRSAVVMERLADVTVVAFDKTGTLTDGAPRVVEVLRTGAATPDETALLRWAAAAELPSEHPVAAAVLAAAAERGIVVPASEDFSSVPGRGVSAVVEGRRLQVGAPVLLDDVLRDDHDDVPLRDALAAVASGRAAGRTTVVVLVDGRPAGVLSLTDRVRPEAARTVAALTRLTGAPPSLLTGDNAGAGRHLAAEVGIADVHAGLLPAGKVERVRALQDGGERVLLVGDGVNDAPALAAADVGVAMGRRGSDLALRSADAVLVHDDLTAMPPAVALARRARRVVVANLVIAASFITVLVVWDLVGDLPLPLGVAGHEGSTVLVGLNGLRLLHRRAWREPGPVHP